MNKYKLRFNENCSYEVEANSEDEALAINVPTSGRKASIEIISAPCVDCGEQGIIKQGKDWVCQKHIRFGI